MKLVSVKLVYFSPTGTTKKILEGISEGLDIKNIEHISMTHPDAETKPVENFTDELVIIGAPVYAGRLPSDAVNRFKRLKAEKTPAVIVVVYGNRDYEDALLELNDLSKTQGFIPVSGGAFIGEHSFSDSNTPIAADRPDTKDMEKAKAFGAEIAKKVVGLQTCNDIKKFDIPGNFPYKKGMPSMPGAPITLADLCIICGTCVDVCPKAAITMSGNVETDPDLCIHCCACVKECPTNARVMELPFVKNISKWLHENCSERKEPEVFI